MTGMVTVMPWLPLPELMMTGMGQPLILASDPAAALAQARDFTSCPQFSRMVLPTRTPQRLSRPSWEMAVLQRTCSARMSSTSEISTVLA